jgi:hypothetical protein
VKLIAGSVAHECPRGKGFFPDGCEAAVKSGYPLQAIEDRERGEFIHCGEVKGMDLAISLVISTWAVQGAR